MHTPKLLRWYEAVLRVLRHGVKARKIEGEALRRLPLSIAIIR
jgi:hypothetical protein